MASIKIIDTILDGNLGEGWISNAKTADALAEYMTDIWANDLEAFSSQGHEVEIRISVQYNTTGHKSPRIVDVDSDDISVSEIERCLTPDDIIWQRFCRSEEAKHL